MKPTRSRLLVPAAALCLLALGLGRTPLCAAGDDDAAHKAAAEDTLKAMHMESLFDATTERMMTQIDRISDGAAQQLGAKPEAAEFQARMHTQTRELLRGQFNWVTLKPDFVQCYADTFSTQELKDLTAFYNTALGQKLIAKQPELSERMGKVSQERAKPVLPQIIKLVREETLKLQGGAPAPGAAPDLGGAPAPGAAPAAAPSSTAAPAPNAAPKATPAKP